MKKKGRPITRVSRSHQLVSVLLTLVLLFTMFPTTAISASDLGPIIADDEATLITPEIRDAFISGDDSVSIQSNTPITGLSGAYYIKNKDSGRMLMFNENYQLIGGYFSQNQNGDTPQWVFECVAENRYIIRPNGSSSFFIRIVLGTLELSDAMVCEENGYWEIITAYGGGVHIRNVAYPNYVLYYTELGITVSQALDGSHSNYNRTVWQMVAVSSYVPLTDFEIKNNLILPGTLKYMQLDLSPATASWAMPQDFTWSIVQHSTEANHQFSVTQGGMVSAPPYGGSATLIITQTHTGFSKQFRIVSGAVAEGIYVLQNKRTGRYLDIEGQSTANDGFLNQYDFHTGNTKKWNVSILPNGKYTFQSVHSGKYMHVAGGYTYAGANIVQYQETGASHSQWGIYHGSSEYFIVPASTSTLALGVPVGQDSNGTRLQQISFNADSDYSDEWKFYKIEYGMNLNVIFDLGYTARHSNTTIAQQRVTAILHQVAIYLMREFKLWVTISSLNQGISYADTCEHSAENVNAHCEHGSVEDCKNTVLNPNGDIAFETLHHHNACNILYRLPTSDSSTTVTIGFIGYDVCREGYDDDGSHYNSLWGLASPLAAKTIIATATANEASDIITKETYVTLHELGHMFSIYDHYDRNGEWSTNDIQKFYPQAQFSMDCIFGEYKGNPSVYQNLTICDGCRYLMQQNIARFTN